MRGDDETAIGLPSKGGDRLLDPASAYDVDGRHGDAKRSRDRLGPAQECNCDWNVRAEQERHPRHVGRRLLEQSQPLAANRRIEALEASDIAARVRKTGHKAAL